VYVIIVSVGVLVLAVTVVVSMSSAESVTDGSIERQILTKKMNNTRNDNKEKFLYMICILLSVCAIKQKHKGHIYANSLQQFV
jgi:hypothetical protein